MISIVIPVYNPDLELFKFALTSALKTQTDEIIIIDDCSDKKLNEYFNFLKTIDDERVRVVYNEKNKGMFKNSTYSITLAKNKYVKKLDSDDEIVVEEFNKLLDEDISGDIIFTKLIWGNKKKNCTNKLNKWILFNGSVVYKTDVVKNLVYKKCPSSSFGDIIPILSILSKKDIKVEYYNYFTYKYNKPKSTAPKLLLLKYSDWVMGYKWIMDKAEINEYSEYTIERQIIFNELLSLKLKINYNEYKYTHYKIFNHIPKFIKKIISYFVFI